MARTGSGGRHRIVVWDNDPRLPAHLAYP